MLMIIPRWRSFSHDCGIVRVQMECRQLIVVVLHGIGTSGSGSPQATGRPVCSPVHAHGLGIAIPKHRGRYGVLVDIETEAEDCTGPGHGPWQRLRSAPTVVSIERRALLLQSGSLMRGKRHEVAHDFNRSSSPDGAEFR